jgi:hypothetical protein
MCYCKLHRWNSKLFPVFIVFALEQKCQDKRHKLKLDNIKEWKIVSLISFDKNKKQKQK